MNSVAVPFARLLKRVLDLVSAAIVLMLLSPVMLVVSLAVFASMGRPILFVQERPGLDGRLFPLFKFRTMRAPERSEVWFRSDAQRLTRVGRVLRKMSLDELPSLWNVVRGDMSLVGPRPLLVEYLPKYTPAQSRRHLVRPGITGLAQVRGRQSLPFSRRLELDTWYVDHWSLLLDLKILLMTVALVLRPADVIPGQNVDDVDDLGLSPDVDSPADETEGA